MRACIAVLAVILMAAQPRPKDPDVLIVGAGIAGLSAALEAANSGLRVVVLEQSSVFGGHAVVSGGNVSITGTPVQEKQKIRDTPELAYADFMRWGEDADPHWARYYAENSRRDVYDWLTALGVTFRFAIPHDGNSVPRLHFPAGKGLGLVTPLYRAALARPEIQFMWNRRATALLIERARVTGVRAENLRTGRGEEYRAGAVVLATGGFQGNLELVREHWPRSLPFPPRIVLGASHHALGGGHALATRAGAALHNMDHQWNYAIGLPDPRDPTGRRGLACFNPASIWINADGRRFANEFAGGKDTLGPLLRQKGATYWAVFDEPGKKSFGVTLAGWNDFNEIERQILNNRALVKTAPTLPELASIIGVPADALQASVARFNDMARAGVDEDFRRFGPGIPNPKPQPIAVGPFYAAQFFPITRKSMGGVKVDAQCRVLDRGGKPLPGLYAVGELTGFGGINGKAALEGTFLGPAIAMGRVAARAIAAPRTAAAVTAAPVPPAPAGAAFADTSCTSCHSLVKKRSGYWHFDRSHAVVAARKLQCASCHAGMHPYRAAAHRSDKGALVSTCTACHGVS